MSKRKVKLTEETNQFGFAQPEFVDIIEERYMKRRIADLTGDNDGTVYLSPLIKRHDSDTYDDGRPERVVSYTMGALDWDVSELDCGPLLGVHDHKGWLTSFWDGSPKLYEIAAVHDAWNAHLEELHIAVCFHGRRDSQTRQYAVTYETTS